MKIEQLVEQEVKVKQIKWDGKPKIGWLVESDSIRLYYGTSIDNAKKIFREGIYPNNDGYVLFAAEPNTASLHSVMRILDESNEPTFSIPNGKRAIFVIDIPNKCVASLSSQDKKFSQKDLYESWGKSDIEYYALVDVHVNRHIPVNWIKGYMLKDGS